MALFSQRRTPNEPGSSPKENNKVPLGSGLISLPLLGGAAWGIHRAFGPFGNISHASGIIGEDNYLKDMVRVGELVSKKSVGYTFADDHLANVNEMTNWHSKAQPHHNVPNFDRIVELSWRQAAAGTKHNQEAINRFAGSLRRSVQKDMVLSAAITRAQGDGVLNAFTKAFIANMGGLHTLTPKPETLLKTIGHAIPDTFSQKLEDKGLKTIGIGDLSKSRQQQIRQLTDQLAKIKGVSVGDITIRERKGLQTAFLQLGFSRRGGSPIKKEVQLPFTLNGKIATGRDMSTFYTAGKFINQVGGKPIGITEHTSNLLVNAATEISSSLSTGHMSSGEVHAVVRRHLMSVSKDERLQWIPGPVLGQIKANSFHHLALPGLQEIPAGLRLSAALEKHQVNMLGEMSLKTIEDLSNTYFPHTSASALAKGRFFTKNFVKDLPFGDRYHAARAPLQFIRDSGPTETARRLMDSYKGGIGLNYGTPFVRTKGALGSLMDRFGYRAPSVRTLFINESTLQKVTGSEGALLMAPEEIVMRDSPHLRGMYQQERLMSSRSISLESGSIHPTLAGGLKTPESLVGQRLDEGSFLGLEAGTGHKLTVPMRPHTESYIAGVRLSEDKKSLELQMKQIQNIHSGSKIFAEGNMAKAVASVQSEGAYGAMTRAYGVEGIVNKYGIEHLASAGHPLKTRGAISRSVVNAMGMIVSQKLAAGQYIRTTDLRRVHEFLANPMDYLAGKGLLEDMAQGGEAVSEFKMLRHAKQAFKFDPSEVGLTGGALAGQVGDKRKYLSPQDIAHISRGNFVGELTGFQDWLEPGRQGSLEPRILRQLLARKDKIGESVAKELAQRIDSPYRIEGMQTIHKVLTDFTSDRDQFNAPTLGISDVDREKMEAGGFYLDTGRKVEAWGGKNKIYVPTPEELEHMGSFRAQGSALDLSSGRVLPKHIATKYNSLFRELADEIDRGTVRDSFERSAKGLRNALYAQEVGYSRLGGKVLGSTRGTGISAYYGLLKKGQVEDRAYISRHAAERMLDEMAEAGQFDKAGRKAFLERWESEGIPALLARHPSTSAMSQQPVISQINRRLDSDKILLPSFPSEEVELEGIGKIGVTKGRMAGLRGDVDADAYDLFPIFNRATQDSVRQHIESGQWAQEYRQHQLRVGSLESLVKQNMIKQGMFDPLPSLGEQAKAAAQVKLVTGPASEALSRLRVSTALHDPDSYNAFSQLSEVLEQTSISGKKGLQASEQLVDALSGLAYDPTNLNEVNFGVQMSNLIGDEGIASLKKHNLFDLNDLIAKVSKGSRSFKGSAAEQQYSQFVKRAKKKNIPDINIEQMFHALGRAEQGVGDVFGNLGNPVARALGVQQKTQRAGASWAEEMLKNINIDTIAEGLSKHKGKVAIGAAAAVGMLGLSQVVRSSNLSSSAMRAQPVPMHQQQESPLNAETIEEGAMEQKTSSFPRAPMTTQLQPRQLQRSLVSVPTKVSVRGRVNEQVMLGSVRRSSGRGITLNRHDSRRLSTPDDVLDRLME